VRLRRIEAEYEGRVQFEWRSYLLRPARRPPPDSEQRAADQLEKFRAYTQSWLRPGSEPDGGDFNTWHSDAGPPSHSVPPHLVAKAAARLGKPAFDAIHERLLRAYFSESRDITNWDTLKTLWLELGLPEEAFAESENPALSEQVFAEHREAVELGATGVPAVRRADDSIVIVGAHPAEMYRRWIERALSET
jgi:predicted DsbA family dithiol-disulfide isomerase